MSTPADLVTLAAGIKDLPTLTQIDAMLAYLSTMPHEAKVSNLIDDILDYRAVLLGTGT